MCRIDQPDTWRWQPDVYLRFPSLGIQVLIIVDNSSNYATSHNLLVPEI